MSRLGKTDRHRHSSHEAPSLPESATPQHAAATLTQLAVESVVLQLGYYPSNLMEVAAGSAERPLVALLYPLNSTLNQVRGRYKHTERKPFPTIFWMVDQALKRRVSQLEDEGWVVRLETRLISSERNVEQMIEAHHKYALARWRLLSDNDVAVVIANGWTKALEEVGVAGMRNPRSVKCLHAHLAHHLAKPEHGNLLGLWVSDLLDGCYRDSCSADSCSDGETVSALASGSEVSEVSPLPL